MGNFRDVLGVHLSGQVLAQHPQGHRFHFKHNQLDPIDMNSHVWVATTILEGITLEISSHLMASCL